MTTSTPSDAAGEADFVCSAGSSARSACGLEQLYKVLDDKPYCVLHFPAAKNLRSFDRAVQQKVLRKDFNFHRVWFPRDYYILGVEFGRAVFTEAIFSGRASFARTTFTKGAFFGEVTFGDGADFWRTTFHEVANFNGAKFGGSVDLDEAVFHAIATFESTTFADAVRFRGAQMFTDDSSLRLQFAKFEKPDLVSFHTVVLRPGWFVNVDPREFEFTNVDWKWRSAEEEVASLRDVVAFPHRMLAIACRHLAVNAEENHRYEEASKFRYMAMDAKRLEHWRGYDFRKLSWWYWLASGYGERILRAGAVLLGLIVIFAALYTRVGFLRWEPRLVSETDAAVAQRDETGAPLNSMRALTYSVAVMTFQRPEPRPATTTAQTIVLLESILGPVQAALLALAIRRKFMR